MPPVSAGDKGPKQPYDVEHRPHDVLPSLMDVLSKAVGRASGNDEDRRRQLEGEIADLLPPRRPRGPSASNDPRPATQRTVSDYLRGKRWPNFMDLEHFTAVVALKTGEDRVNLWKLSIDGVEHRLQSPEADERMQAARAVLAAQDAHRLEEPEKPDEQSNG
jgi:hypothetical protein